ncbi:TrmH family RNA methyltransferase [Nitrospina watsonii]|uniref:tRNA/rRNA methyltransferase n=1 Tax=Nitrospina watsonii TaxID=1323948 RepID=A0ABM9HHF7_9BACT|nr:RNA methyltransferase [Nitrospina watsonii]CAI2719589.1 Putative tRNA/rRNA methyltransferase [Nitrospina watsonii]
MTDRKPFASSPDKRSPHRNAPPKKKHVPLKEREWTLCGWNACMRAFEQRPDGLLRLYYHKDRSKALYRIKQWCAKRKLPYRELDEESLNRAAAGVHHEGVVMVTAPLPVTTLYKFLEKPVPANWIGVAFDGVANTHNVGAVLRSCAYFGVRGVLLEKAQRPVAVASSTARTAEGALEVVPMYECADLSSGLRDLKSKNVFVIGTDPEAKDSLYDVEIPFPCVLVLGGEKEGLSKRVRDRCDKVVRIPGETAIQSLNVSVAAGVVLGEMHRRLHTPSHSHSKRKS